MFPSAASPQLKLALSHLCASRQGMACQLWRNDSIQSNQDAQPGKRAGDYSVPDSCSTRRNKNTPTYTDSRAVTSIDPLETLWVLASVQVKLEWHEVTVCLPHSASLLSCYTSLSKQRTALGLWPRSTKVFLAPLESWRNGLVWHAFHLPVSWMLIHWEPEMLSAPHESYLFACFTWLNNDMMDDQMYPPKLTLPVCVCVHMLIRRPHTIEHCPVFSFTEAPKALEAYISPYQRTLIAPRMSAQIHVHTSIHEAHLMHLVCALRLLFIFFYLQSCDCTYGTHSDSCAACHT